MSNEIADEIRELRKVREGETSVYVDMEAKLTPDSDVRALLERMVVAAEKQATLLAVQNDLLAELVLNQRPQPKRKRDRLPDFILAVLTIYLLAIFTVQIVRAVT